MGCSACPRSSYGTQRRFALQGLVSTKPPVFQTAALQREESVYDRVGPAHASHQRPDAADEGQLVLENSMRVPADQEVLLRETLLGSRVFLAHQRCHHRSEEGSHQLEPLAAAGAQINTLSSKLEGRPRIRSLRTPLA